MDAGEHTGQGSSYGAEHRPEFPAPAVTATTDQKDHDCRYEQQDGKHEHRYPPPETDLRHLGGDAQRIVTSPVPSPVRRP
ncbi:hypothetical protein SGFS_009230 [Streptomyces graminofaciens]|uniref:Uncharacterized protein n=1 Tax=Streptomyces graminofaciens TaxID=68212 RepID=A0ABN5V8R4_9ACTN|nr:hypothetical protein SGFS_009230 [Streptomyces graminofaciens]